MKRRILSGILAAVMLLGLLTACGTYTNGANTGNSQGDQSDGTTAPEAREKTKEGYGSLSFTYTEPNTLNMLTSQSNLDSDTFYLTSVMLYRPYGNEILPEMALECERSEDGLTYTYTLREANYVDGTPITAADFVYYIIYSSRSQTSITPYLANGAAFLAGECDASEVGAYAPDEHTLVVELEAATAAFDPEMTIYPLNQTFAESKGDALGGTPEDFLCSGPYILTDWTYGASLTFEKNPDYWDAENSFQIAELTLLHNPDKNAAYNMFVAGEADIIMSTDQDVQSRLPDNAIYRKTGGLQGVQFNTTGYYFDGTTFAQKDAEVTALLQNVNFRKALCYALDREAIVSAVDATSVPTNRYLGIVFGTTAETSFIEENPIDVAPVNGDAELAKQYLETALEELGYNDVSELPTIQYLTFENDVYRLMAETLQSEWKRVLGIENIEIDLRPIQDAIMAMVNMNYDIYYQATSVYPTSPITAMDWWTTEGGLSDIMGARTGFSALHANPDFDEKVKEAEGEFDEAKRNALIAEAEEMFLNTFIFIPILEQGKYTIVSDRVDGFVTADAVNGLMFNNAVVTD